MKRVSAVQSVVEVLRSEISLRYKPGDYLQNERLVAERLGVSRNTVREALIHLEAFGVIEKTQRGPRVCAPDIGAVFHIMDQYFDRSLKTCRDLLNFRRMIDIGVLPVVLERIDDADIDELECHVEWMEQTLTAGEAAQADYAFHNKIARISDNSVVIKLYKVLSTTLTYYMEIGKSSPSNSEKTVLDHRQIIQACRNRSLDEAVAAFTEHYDCSERSVAKALEKAPKDGSAREGQR